ncbi:MAG TPA: YbaK/EbsC family protein [Anaerolineales bacterium]|nr:YbaK/EbsC family protein [Anaerolineales bacterium]
MDRSLASTDLAAFLVANRIDGEILYLDVPTPTVESAAAAVGAGVDQIVKTILFLVEEEPLAAIACGVKPVEQRAIASHLVMGRKRVKLASPSQVLEVTGYAAGAVPPFGHLNPIRTLLDLRVLEQEVVYAGGGDENALVRLSSRAILQQTGAGVLDLISPPRGGG